MATATKIKSESDNEAGGGKRNEHSSELLTRAVAAVTTSVSDPWPVGVGPLSVGADKEGPGALPPELGAVHLVILARELRVGPSNVVEADLQAHRRFCNTPCCCYCCYSPCKGMRADITLGSTGVTTRLRAPERMADPPTDRTAGCSFTWRITCNNVAP